MYPSYLNFSIKEIEKRAKAAQKMLNPCCLCPRNCKVNRLEDERGICRLGKKAMVSFFYPHFGEEKCLVGTHGSGAIFFTYCNLSCVYCQNYEISQMGVGKEVSKEEIADIMLKLQKFGCHNVNLIIPGPQVPQILEAIPIAIEKGLKLPLIYNTNSYDSVETLKLLDGIVDIYLANFLYSDEKVAIRWSAAPKYPKIAKEAIKEMYRQVGDLEINTEGVAKRGLLVRHLVLPGGLAGTEKVMEFLAKEISKNTFVNIMAQYRPCWKAWQNPPLDRPITVQEYVEAKAAVKKAGLKRGYLLS
jgi:putative pyruvate formate lyase activating enzyme